jgi:hypothetical protein
VFFISVEYSTPKTVVIMIDKTIDRIFIYHTINLVLFNSCGTAIE